ncbi:MAG TPA: hypothetical protein VML91_18940 [Burkholderiales bacterium]|nr:hypothetical protein [Burkholderiales bacterium]
MSIRPYLRKTSWPAATSSAVNTTSPPGVTAFTGIGGAFWYARSDIRMRTAKPKIMTMTTLRGHHADNVP